MPRGPFRQEDELIRPEPSALSAAISARNGVVEVAAGEQSCHVERVAHGILLSSCSNRG
jgi:hypothetical protein